MTACDGWRLAALGGWVAGLDLVGKGGGTASDGRSGTAKPARGDRRGQFPPFCNTGGKIGTLTP